MAKGNRYRRSRTGRYRKGQGEEPEPPVLRVTLFTALICLACVLRFSDSAVLIGLREQMGAAIRTDTDYKGAVAVLGRAIAGESRESENAIVVFGRMVLGLEGAAESEGDSFSIDEGEGEQEPEEESENPPITQSRIKPNERVGDNSSDLTLWDGAGDLIHGLPNIESDYPTVAEAVMPVFLVSHSISQAVSGEVEDCTPNEEFVIPSPDLIDDTLYTIPFSYSVPLRGTITSYFGYRIHPVTGNTTFHHGADIAAATGTAVCAFADGTISQIGYNSVYGNYLKIQHADGFLSMYAHLDKITVKEGKSVKEGDKVALSGNTGTSTGPHLHFEIRRDGKILNPFHYLSFD